MTDDVLDAVQEYQRLEKSIGEPKLRWLEAKSEARAELQERGFTKAQADTLIKALPTTLAAREFMSGASVRLNTIEACNDLLDSPAGKQALGLHHAEKEAAFRAALEKMSPAEKINAWRAAGHTL